MILMAIIISIIMIIILTTFYYTDQLTSGCSSVQLKALLDIEALSSFALSSAGTSKG